MADEEITKETAIEIAQGLLDSNFIVELESALKSESFLVSACFRLAFLQALKVKKVLVRFHNIYQLINMSAANHRVKCHYGRHSPPPHAQASIHFHAF